jgi:hypothetical protein
MGYLNHRELSNRPPLELPYRLEPSYFPVHPHLWNMPRIGVRCPEDVLNQAEGALEGCSAHRTWALGAVMGLAAKAQPDVYTQLVDLFWPPC